MKLSDFCFGFGLLSIPLSIAVWFVSPELGGVDFNVLTDAALREVLKDAHSQRWGLFVGLWAPTLLILSEILHRKGH